MSIHKVTNIVVGNGSALPANNAQVSPSAIARLGIYGSDMLALNPAGGDTMSTAGGDAITFFQELADGSLKKTFPVKGVNVTGAKAIHYRPARRNVWSIGYHRGFRTNPDEARATIATAYNYTAAGGDITVANSTEYKFTIRFKSDKTFYSERPEVLNVSFTSSASTSQKLIAIQIANAINNSAFGNQPTGIKVIQAVVVSDGTGVTAATATTPVIYGETGNTGVYGVEITALTSVNQFTNSSYKEQRVYFSVHVDDNSGFGTTTECVEMQANSYGEGTYNFVSNMENFLAQYEGINNRRAWPAQTVTLTSSATPVTSANVAAAATNATGNVGTTISEDLVTVATDTIGLNGGDLIDINGVAYEIKYIRSSTSFVITEAASATYAGANLKVKYFYNLIVIEFTDSSFIQGADAVTNAKKSIIIATPAIDAGAADPFDTTKDSADTSAEALDLYDVLNGWLATTPLAPAAIAYKIVGVA